jgi:hypothetical protein
MCYAVVTQWLRTLGERIFAIGGRPYGNIVEEYNYEVDSWSIVTAKLANSIYYSSVLKIPAALFDFLIKGCIGIV